MTQLSSVQADLALNSLLNTTQNTKTESTTEDFSKILTDTLKNQLTENSITVGTSSNSSSTNMSSVNNSGTIETLIMTAAATGEASDAELALFMLCLMMQESESSDMAPLMNAMAAMLPSVSGGTETIRENVLNSDYSAYVKDTVDKNVFKTTATALPSEAWKSSTPAITGNESNRSADRLRKIIDQFDVENAERYRPYRKGGDTYCNIFLWDVTKALGAEIPHYVDAATGQPRSYPDIKGAKELGANATHDWLIKQGQQYGWREVSAQEAQAYANQGKPAVTAWKNPTGASGHVQVVCPSKDGGYDSIRGVAVAQAGSQRNNYTHISSTFGSSKLSNVRYFVHE